jgi:mono/diheme cytochrome c family protein
MRIILFTLLVHISSIAVFAQEWIVPADKKVKLSPFQFTDETRKAGERLFTINCISCHGTPGKGNFLKNLVPPPGDPATEKIQHNLDGEIFYKVSQGRGPMPSFKNVLTPSDIWSIISYLRTFNKTYIQSVLPVIASSAYPGAVIGVSLSLNSAKDKISMKVTAVTEKSAVPVKGAGVKLFVKRTFGQLLLDEEKTTDIAGIAVFNVPAAIPGDTAGNISVSARFVDEEKFSAVSKDTILKAGTKVILVSLTSTRSMWNVVRKAPLWIILTYSLGVLGVWGFIFLILLKLRDIYIVGVHLSSDPGNVEKENKLKSKE